MATAGDLVSVKTDSAGLTYQIVVNPGTNFVEFDTNALKPPQAWMCPRSIVIELGFSDHETNFLYSSSWLNNDSALRIPSWQVVGTNFVSEKYPIETILPGVLVLQLKLRQIKAIDRIRIEFCGALRINGSVSWQTVHSDWIKLNNQLRELLIESRKKTEADYKSSGIPMP